ncbi:uncharacterized protein LOC127700802 isoform X4 [Mytilus californianus]|uniref:uncharacterized protein LOC127700802 isoform X4 n=1 Tax=Mytilus californianus TaxID=6549 RepID=UPI0022466D82|nr:uncharacterized protein LOC127700802 isoform X4 [Mytilus californianus]
MAQASTQICRLCTQNSGVYYCYECQNVLCTICRERHDLVQTTSGHTITNTSTIDIADFSKTSKCRTHDKEFVYICEMCNDFICSKCVISTHKDHSFLEIAGVVSEEREKAKRQITDLSAKVDAIPIIQDKVRGYIDQLHVDSKNCIVTIDSVCVDLQTFIETKKNIKVTEVEDYEILEHQSYEAFMKNNELTHKRYTQIKSELENLLFEKHDNTFHSCYGVIDIDIQTLVNIPAEPLMTQVQSFENKMLYKEITEYMESKVDHSLCRMCPVHQKRIDKILKENESLKVNIQRYTKQMIQKEDENRRLKLENECLKAKCTKQITQKNEEIRSMKGEIECLMARCTKQMTQKDEEIRSMKGEIECLMAKYTKQMIEKDGEYKSLKGGFECFKTECTQHMSQKEDEIRSLKREMEFRMAKCTNQKTHKDNEIIGLKRKLETLKDKCTNQKTYKDNEIRGLKRKLETLNDNYLRCNRFGNYGHVARECQSTCRVECYNCRNIGHYSRNCPNR